MTAGPVRTDGSDAASPGCRYTIDSIVRDEITGLLLRLGIRFEAHGEHPDRTAHVIGRLRVRAPVARANRQKPHPAGIAASTWSMPSGAASRNTTATGANSSSTASRSRVASCCAHAAYFFADSKYGLDPLAWSVTSATRTTSGTASRIATSMPWVSVTDARPQPWQPPLRRR